MTVYLGVDMGDSDGDWTACHCARCATPHRWRKRAPKRCRHCGALFNFTGLVVAKAEAN